MRLKLVFIFLVLILVSLTYSKRSRGRSRGSSTSGGTSYWSRKNNKGSSEPKQSKPVPSAPKQPVNQAKPSAPKEPEIKKETAKVQQSAPNSGRPIGWNVDNNNSPRKASSNLGAPPPYTPYQHNTGANPHGVYSGGYHQNTGGYPGYGASQHGGGYSNYPNSGYNTHGGSPGNNYGQYPGQMGGYGGGHGYNPHVGGQYPGQMGGYGGGQGYNPHVGGQYPGQMGGYGGGHGYNPHAPGQYPGQMGGYGHQTGMMGGYGGYPQQTGMMGRSQGFGYGGMGALAGAGAGYGMSPYKKPGGFFGKHAFRNVLGGLFVGYLVSGLFSRPYRVHNYYNTPQEERKEINLPSNVLTLCNENATNICVPGTTALCTMDNKILCVTTMSSAAPCKDNNGELCVSSTIPCLDGNDPLCQNKTSAGNTTTINLPCFTNMTLDTSQATNLANLTVPFSEDHKYCVTTMAEPDPTKPVEEIKKESETSEDYLTPPYIGRYASQFPDEKYSAEHKRYQLQWNPFGFARYGSTL